MEAEPALVPDADGRAVAAEVSLTRELTVEPLPDHVIEAVVRPAVDLVARQVADDVAASLVVEDASGDAPDEAYTASVRRNVTRAAKLAMRQFVSLCETGSQHIDVTVFREIGYRHAVAGHARAGLAEIYREGTRSMWRHAVALCVDEGIDPTVLVPVVDAVFALAVTMSDAAFEGFDAGVAESVSSAAARRQQLVRRLLASASDRAKDTERGEDCRRAGWPLPDRAAVAVATTSGPATRWPDAVLASPMVGHVALVLPAPLDEVTRGLEERLDAGVVAVGPTVAVDRLRASYGQARRLHTMVVEDGTVRSGVVRVEDHVVDLMLERQPDLVAHLVRERLAPLLALPARRREPLLETLVAWLRRPGQVSAIAQDLHVHSQTVRYRVERLRELLGPQLEDPERRVDLELAARAIQRDVSAS